MRLTTDWRRAFALIAIVGLAGCNNKPKGTSAGPAGDDTTGLVPSVLTPRQSADVFLKNLTEGKATPDQLTDGFKKQIAKPMLDVEVADWLASFKGTNFVIGEELKFGDTIVLRGRAELPSKKEAFALRMTKDLNGYKADWLHRAERMGTGITSPSDPDLAAAQDVVRNFLDLLMGGDHRMVFTLMVPEWRKQKAPPHDADKRKGFDFDPGFLGGQTRSWASGLVGYTFGKSDLSPMKDRATFPVEFETEGKKSQETLTAAKDPTTGRWLVVAFTK